MRGRQRRRGLDAVLAVVVVVAVLGCGVTSTVPRVASPAGSSLKKLSVDLFNNGGVDHKTEVEPDTYSYGNTIVATYQIGRSPTAGATDNGWATSKNNGGSWTSGTLPNLTKDVGGTYDRAGDPSVAYDPKLGLWIIMSVATVGLGLGSNGKPVFATDVVLSTSANGGTIWNDPVLVAHSQTNTQPYDKPWLVCDTSPASLRYGRCYASWGVYTGAGVTSPAVMAVAYSDNPAQASSWTMSAVPPTTGAGTQMLVQPNGTVIIPYSDATDIPGDTQGKSIFALVSTDYGAHFNAPVKVSSLDIHVVDGSMRAFPLPSAEIDTAGKVYVVWQDCRFEPLCATNDLVLSTSPDGVHWTPVQRIPIHPVGSGVDEFIPGLAVDKMLPTSKGATAHLGVAYYFYPVTPCTMATCQLYVGFVQSKNGGQTWTNEIVLAGPMHLTWLPTTQDGYMVGDYISSSIPKKGQVYPVFAVAHPPNGAQCDPATQCDEAMYTVTGGL